MNRNMLHHSSMDGSSIDFQYFSPIARLAKTKIKNSIFIGFVIAFGLFSNYLNPLPLMVWSIS
ncbi:hypothetical protein BpHYR1_025491 [Brachionus plicatilis]|uniref:Uncharacterized protein n=1 Tax=Brachionus plicatilis TaxID=10195 RepID=A0A3M7PC21_BRAPC|nr:hypothetical protein BpHYR1_025491 [Brachionus plicatilis]